MLSGKAVTGILTVTLLKNIQHKWEYFTELKSLGGRMKCELDLLTMQKRRSKKYNKR